jgi:hypothetical protein
LEENRGDSFIVLRCTIRIKRFSYKVSILSLSVLREISQAQQSLTSSKWSMRTEASVLVAWSPVSLPVNVDLIAVRLGPSDRFAFGIAFEQQGPRDLLFHRMVDRWIEVFWVLDPYNVNARHVTSVVV